MKLRDVLDSNRSIPFDDIGRVDALALDVQTLLTTFGLLDPPADGKFGPVSRWALGEAFGKLGLPARANLDKNVARQLLEADPEGLFPSQPVRDFAGAVVRALRSKQYWLCRHPDCVNIVYVEGVNLDGTPNDDGPNAFNDVRLILEHSDEGVPRVAGIWEATTAPGRLIVNHPYPGTIGAAHIALGQFKSWAVGLHGEGKDEHQALVQTEWVTVFRDVNRDFRRTGDPTQSGYYGINQHWGYDYPVNDIRNASGGCLVGRLRSGHVAFMAMVKGDARYRQSTGYRFMTSILDRSELEDVPLARATTPETKIKRQRS